MRGVGTEIDFDSTYVGGSKPFIDAILQSEGLESLEVGSTDSTSVELPERIIAVVNDDVDELLLTGRALGDCRTTRVRGVCWIALIARVMKVDPISMIHSTTESSLDTRSR